MGCLLRSRKLLIFCLVAAAAGCAGEPLVPDDLEAEQRLVAARPYEVDVPGSYDAAQPTPMVLLLHAYKTSGALQKLFFGFPPLVEQAGFLLAYPEGSTDRLGEQFWNATDGCCNLDGSPVDDVAYLRAVLHDMQRRYNVDRQRIFVVGHSNGGFMSHRLACELSDEIAGIASLAGALWISPERCQPTSPVAVLAIHGDLDDVVRYDGGGASPPLTGPYPSARETVAQWARHDGCDTLRDTGQPLDLASDVDGPETRIERHENCRTGAVELWTMVGGGHYPVLLPAFGSTLWNFLQAHPKPAPPQP
jgi:polyhydroxybutyrate depolymerase